LQALGADLVVALAAAASGQPIPTLLPSAAAAAALAKEAEEKAAAAAAAISGGSNGGTVPTEQDGSRLEPPTDVKDKLTKLVNNLVADTVSEKSREVAEQLKPDFYAWFASQMIVDRAVRQANFQPVYQVLLESMGLRELDAAVLRASLDLAKKILASDKIKSSTGERANLKNVGSWLGKITLARNKPLLHKDLNLKELLYEAYETGRLIAVVPFVTKMFESLTRSSVFKPPNPWTLAILSSLRELYDVVDLKLNLKFDMELLAKTINVDYLKLLRPAFVLPKRRRPDLRNNSDFKQNPNPEALPGIAGRESSEGGAGGSGSGGGIGGTPQIPGIVSLVTLRYFGPIFHSPAAAQLIAAGPHSDSLAASEAISSIAHEIISGGPSMVDPGPDTDIPGTPKANLRNLVALALDGATRDLIHQVVERSVHIAVMTTRELVTKDFALEPDPDIVLRAAQALACDLAGSMAIATGIEPLKAQTGAKLRDLLTTFKQVLVSMPVMLKELGDDAVNALLGGVVSENLEAGTLLFEKAAMEKAVKAVSESMASLLQDRRKALESGLPWVGAPQPQPLNAFNFVPGLYFSQRSYAPER